MTTLTVEIEHVLREHGPLTTDGLAAVFRRSTSTVLAALDCHPLIVSDGNRNGGTRWRLIDAPAFGPLTDGDQVKPSEVEREPAPDAWVAIVCPDCGCHHEITRGHLRKIERGTRSARCGLCSEMRVYRAGAMTAAQREALMRWWLLHHTDDQLAEIAHALGLERATARGFQAARAMLLSAGSTRERRPRSRDRPRCARRPARRPAQPHVRADRTPTGAQLPPAWMVARMPELPRGALGAEGEQVAAAVRPVAPPLGGRGQLVHVAPALGAADRVCRGSLTRTAARGFSRTHTRERRHWPFTPRAHRMRGCSIAPSSLSIGYRPLGLLAGGAITLPGGRSTKGRSP